MISFRPAIEADEHFIVSSWTQSYRDSYTAGFIQVEDWYAIMDAQVAKAMKRPDVRSIVACSSDDPDQLLGFITADTEEKPPLVYYVYVKKPFRKGGRGRLWNGPGCARGLFAAIGIDPAKPFYYVCETAVVPILERKIPMAKHMPLYGRFPKHERKQGR